MQQKQLVQQLMFGVRMNRETAGSKQQSFNATDIKNVQFTYKEQQFLMSLCPTLFTKFGDIFLFNYDDTERNEVYINITFLIGR